MDILLNWYALYSNTIHLLDIEPNCPPANRSLRSSRNTWDAHATILPRSTSTYCPNPWTALRSTVLRKYIWGHSILISNWLYLLCQKIPLTAKECISIGYVYHDDFKLSALRGACQYYVRLFDLPMTAEYCGIRCYCACTLEHFLMLPIWRPIQKQLVAWQISVRTPGSPSPRAHLDTCGKTRPIAIQLWPQHDTIGYGECSACESCLASTAG